MNLRERPSRISGRGYFHGGTFLDRWKLRLTLLAMVLTVGWIASGMLRPSYGVERYSHGPLAAVHATWDTKCEACHEPFQPVNDNTWLHGERSPDPWRNLKCEGCHTGTVHHTSIKVESMASCGGCHRDHQGRDASLVRVADADCTRCHNNPGVHMKPGIAATFDKAVTSFPTNHPDFRFKATFKPEDRGLKFNHAVHNVPGLSYAPGSARSMTYGRLLKDAGEEAAKRYFHLEEPNGTWDAAALKDRPVTLDCMACHQLEGTDFKPTAADLKGLPRASLEMVRQDGKYFQPIAFEKDCKSCHPLTFSDDTTKSRTVPHRLQPPEIDQFLATLYEADILKRDPKRLERRLPVGDRLDARTDPESDTRSAAEEVKRMVTAGRKQILEKRMCLECHDTQGDSIRPANIPTVWLKNAKFDHAAHRAADCQSCHPTTKGVPDSAVKREPSHLPGIDNCRQCHSPATAKSGGARYDCVECHRYHDGDHPLAGRGTIRRDPLRPYDDAGQFLKGAR